MDVELKQTLYRNLSEVFEKMFFTMLESLPDYEPQSASAGQYLEAVISYQGGRNGTIRLFFPEPLARSITQDFLGIGEESLTEAQILDMTKEATNMAVGSLLGDLDPQGSCRLSIPVCRRLDGLAVEELQQHPGGCAFKSDHGTLWLVLEES